MAEPGFKPMPLCSRMYTFLPVLKLRESEECEGKGGNQIREWVRSNHAQIGNRQNSLNNGIELGKSRVNFRKGN